MWEAIIPAAASAFGSFLSSSGQKDANFMNQVLAQHQMEWSANEAAKNRDFQERMSNTAHQRAVADLSAAGLNPMLSIMQGAASTPHGAMGSSPGLPRMENAKGAGVASAIAAGVAAAQIDKLKAETRNTDTQTSILQEQVPHAPEMAHLALLIRKHENYVNNYQENIISAAQEARIPQALAERVLEDIKHIKQEIRTARSMEDLLSAEAKLKRLEVPKGEAYESYFRGLGKFEPYLHGAGQAVGIAKDVAVGAAAGRFLGGQGLRHGTGSAGLRPVFRVDRDTGEIYNYRGQTVTRDKHGNRTYR